MIRQPIIAVLGHVDAGKTSFLDSIRSTNIADKEPGKITQHIGATEIPYKIIDGIAGDLIKKFGFNVSIPGLLFIDTPGHEAFNNLRERGGSIADLAVVVVDIQKGVEPQTAESLQMLKNYKVPFIIAANKIDMIREYSSQPGSFIANLKNQDAEGLQVLDTRIYELVGKLFDQGFQSERFDRVKDFTKEICIVPMSAMKKEGLPEVLMLLSGLSQKFLEKNLKIEVSGPGKGTVLEVKEVKGIGTTIDAIIYDGTIKVGEEIVVAGNQGVIQTKIKALMQSKTLTDLRVADKFNSLKEVHASAGVKIAAQKLEEAIAGSPLLVVSTGKEKEIIEKEVKRILFESQVNGVIVKADTLGAVEAITKLFQQAGIPVRRVGIGAVSKRDILEALSVKDKDKLLGVVFAFNVEMNELAGKELQKNPIQVFQEKIVYNLIKNYSEWKEGILNEEKKAMKEGLMFPAKFKILKGLVFRNNKPAIVGIKVLEGRLRKNVDIMNKDGKMIGRLVGLQEDKETLDQADAGDEVAASIEDANVGRNVFEEETLFTALSANQIQRLKELQEKGGDLSREELALLEEIEKMQGINQE